MFLIFFFSFSVVKREIFLKVDNVVHQIKDKIAEIKVHVPKHTFFVKHESKHFEESFDLAIKAVIDIRLISRRHGSRESPEKERMIKVLIYNNLLSY